MNSVSSAPLLLQQFLLLQIVKQLIIDPNQPQQAHKIAKRDPFQPPKFSFSGEIQWLKDRMMCISLQT